MIRHVVLFNLNPGIENADRECLFGQIHGLAKVSSVKRLSLGKLLEPREDWYKPRLATDFTWCLSMEFENEDGLYAYQTDPYHVTVAQEIRKRVTIIKVMDFVSLQK